MADWGKLLEQLQGQTKTKINALDSLQSQVQSTALARDQISSLLDYTPQLLSDNNFKVALKLLRCWQGVVSNSQDLVKPYLHGLLPPVVERLGDNKQDVRQAACDLLLDILQVQRADIMMDKLSRFWSHKNWKVRHGMLQFVAEAICSTGNAVLAIPRDDSNWVLHKVIQLVEDPESAVRDAAIECLEEVYRVYGEQLMDVLNSHQLRPAHLNLIYNRMAQLGASVGASPAQSGQALDQQDAHRSPGAGTFLDGLVRGQESQAGEVSSMVSAPAVSRQNSMAPGAAAGQLKSCLRSDDGAGCAAASKGVNSTAGDAAQAGKIKRGGYMDGGGVTKDGGLPPAPILSVSGERELTHELETIIDALNKGAAVDWEKRVSAMVRLEGLVKGGAAGEHEGCFMEHLRMLKDPLLDQMVDRRSAVARQAAHLFSVLAAALGIRFEQYAITFIGALFKGLVITVQVVSEASDAAARGILRHCHTAKLVGQVCDILTGDKSAKLRKHCSAYLLQILEGWEPHEYTHYLDSVDAALTAAVQDALGETRTNGRTSFAAYAAVLPERAAALLKRFDSGLQQKLHEAVLAYGKGQTVVAPVKQRTRQPPPSKPWKSGGNSGNSATDPEIVIVAGPPPAASQWAAKTTNSRGGSSNGAQRSTAAPTVMPETTMTAGLAAALSAAPPRPSRKSVAGVPKRVPGGQDVSSYEVAGAVAGTVATGGRRRTSMMPQRVPYTVAEAPARMATIVAGRMAVGVGSLDAPTYHMGPDSSDSFARSDTSAFGETMVEDHKGVAMRLHQPHPKQLAARQVISSAVSSGGDDLQMQLLLRDQLQAPPQLQQQVHLHTTHHGTQYGDTQHALTVQDRSSSSLSMALSASGAHGHSMLHQQAAKPATLSKAVAGMLSTSQGWQDRVDKMTALAEALNRQLEVDSRPEAFAEVEKVVPKLMSAIDDAHFKVSLSALSLLQVCINVCPGALESSLEKLMPLLFLKLCAGKQSVRSAAEAALQACALEMDADVLMAPLNRSLDAMKQPAARVSVMEFVVLFMGVGRVAGLPSSSAHLRQWVSKNIPLLLDKNPNVRQMAGKSLATIYSIDPHTVAACLQQATPQEVTAVQRSLANAEAKAAAAEAAAAAAEQAASWAHQTSGQAFSVTSSADLSQNGFAASEQHAYAAENSDQHIHMPTAVANAQLAAAQQANTLAAEISALAVSESTMQQQQLHYMPGPADMQQHCREQVGLTQDHPGLQAYPTASNRHPQQALTQQPQMHGQQQQQVQYSNQQQHLSQDSMHAAQHMASTQPAHGMLAAPRDLLGRPVPAAAAASPGASGVAAVATLSTTQPQLQGQPANNLSGAAVMAGTNAHQPHALQPQLGQATASAEDSSAPAGSSCASAAAMAAASAAAAGDASSQARHLTVLVHRLQSRPAEDVLAELAACAGVLSSQAWEANFSKVLLAGLSAAQNSNETIRELAFLLVLALAQHHSCMFGPVLDVVLQPLLQGCGDESREVLVAAQSTLDVLMLEMPPLHCADILSHKLPSEAATSSGTAVDGDVLCATIRCLQLMSRRMSPTELLAVAPTQLLPGLFAAFHHPRPDVRKAVVFCLVDMWHQAGEGLTPYLASLSTSQLKLLTIYYNRAQGKQQGLSGQHSEAQI